MNIIKTIKNHKNSILALLAGAIYPLGFAPFNMAIFAILSPVIFLWTIEGASKTKAGKLGFLYGLGLFGVGVHWVYYSIHDFGNAPYYLAGLITFLLVAYLSIFFAALGFILNAFFKKRLFVKSLLAFPALWVILEAARGWLLTGFPWLYTGYSQMGNHLSAFAPIAGVWGVSLATATLSGFVFAIFAYYYYQVNKKSVRNGLFLGIIALWGVAFFANTQKFSTPDLTKPLAITMVQGSIPQQIRWDPKYISNILDTYSKLTQQAIASDITPDLIIWPESAIPVPIPSVYVDQYIKAIIAGLNRTNTGLILGIPVVANSNSFYNSLIGLGKANGNYAKHNLVPFGEYVPLENLLRGLIDFFDLPMSTFIPGKDLQNPLTIMGLKFAPLICYEIAYPNYVQATTKVTNANFLLTVSNDAWFGKSIGPYQHLQIAQFRAKETGMYLARATNNGFTAIVNHKGQIDSIAPQFATTNLTGNVYPTIGKTPWLRFGSWPIYGLISAMLILALFLSTKEN